MFMISGDNLYKQLFDLYIMALVLYVAIVVPFRLGFNIEETKVFKVIGYVIDISFFVDMVLTFFTSFYDE